MKWIIFIYFLTIHAASFAQTIELAFNTKVKALGQDQFSDKKSGEKIVMKAGESLILQPENQIPFVILSPSSSDSNIKLSLSDMTEVTGPYINKKVQDSTEQIVSEIKKIEILVRKKDLSAAQGRIASLKSKYGVYSQVLFLSATINFLTQNKALAIQELNKGLEIDPNDEAAKNLLQRMLADKK